MKATTIAAIVIAMLGIPLIFAWKYTAPVLEQHALTQSSDAVQSKGTVAVGVDNFIGYYPLCSPHLRTLMRAEGYEFTCIDDEADYVGRFQKVKEGKLPFAVATVDSYELKALQSQYPGLFITVIDHSQGADGAVACNEKVKNIDDLKHGGLKVAFAPGTASEHLIKVVATQFDIPQLRSADKSWRVETKSSAEAAKKCLDGSVDVAVMWEPDITKTLKRNPKASKLIGTDFSPNVVMDILIVRREYASAHPNVVKMVLRRYFETLYYYRQHPDTAIAHALDYVNASTPVDARLTEGDVKKAMEGVRWVNLAENATLEFGIAEPGPGIPPKYGLIEAIVGTARILTDAGDFTMDPSHRPPDDARLMIQSGFVKELYETGLASGETVDTNNANSLSRQFAELTNPQWQQMKEIGTLRVRPVNFQTGSDDLLLEAKENIDHIVEAIKNYPSARIVIEGHTSTRGDSNENLVLSQDRADSVAKYLQVTYQVDPNRIHAVGLGGVKPLVQNAGESNREYLNRLPRVVVKLVREEL